MENERSPKSNSLVAQRLRGQEFRTGNIHKPNGLNVAQKASVILKTRLFYTRRNQRDIATKYISQTWIEYWIKKDTKTFVEQLGKYKFE